MQRDIMEYRKHTVLLHIADKSCSLFQISCLDVEHMRIVDTAFWNKWKFNYGVGLRIQMQPGKNFRLDVGKDPNQKGMAVYMNMTEAF